MYFYFFKYDESKKYKLSCCKLKIETPRSLKEEDKKHVIQKLDIKEEEFQDYLNLVPEENNKYNFIITKNPNFEIQKKAMIEYCISKTGYQKCLLELFYILLIKNFQDYKVFKGDFKDYLAKFKGDKREIDLLLGQIKKIEKVEIFYDFLKGINNRTKNLNRNFSLEILSIFNKTINEEELENEGEKCMEILNSILHQNKKYIIEFLDKNKDNKNSIFKDDLIKLFLLHIYFDYTFFNNTLVDKFDNFKLISEIFSIFENFLDMNEKEKNEEKNILREVLCSFYFFKNKKQFTEYQALFTLIPIKNLIFRNQGLLDNNQKLNLIEPYFNNLISTKRIVIYKDETTDLPEKYKKVILKPIKTGETLTDMIATSQKNYPIIINSSKDEYSVFSEVPELNPLYQIISFDSDMKKVKFRYDDNRFSAKELLNLEKQYTELGNFFLEYVNENFKQVLKDIKEDSNVEEQIEQKLKNDFGKNFMTFIDSNKILEEKELIHELTENYKKNKFDLIKSSENNKTNEEGKDLILFPFLYTELGNFKKDYLEEFQNWEKENENNENEEKTMDELQKVLNKAKNFSVIEKIPNIKDEETINKYLISLIKKDFDKMPILTELLSFSIKFQLKKVQQFNSQKKLLYLYLWIFDNISILCNLSQLTEKINEFLPNENNTKSSIDFNQINESDYFEDSRKQKKIFIQCFSLIFDYLIKKTIENKIYFDDFYMYSLIIAQAEYVNEKFWLLSREYYKASEIYLLFSFLSKKMYGNVNSNQLNNEHWAIDINELKNEYKEMAINIIENIDNKDYNANDLETQVEFFEKSKDKFEDFDEFFMLFLVEQYKCNYSNDIRIKILKIILSKNNYLIKSTGLFEILFSYNINLQNGVDIIKTFGIEKENQDENEDKSENENESRSLNGRSENENESKNSVIEEKYNVVEEELKGGKNELLVQILLYLFEKSIITYFSNDIPDNANSLFNSSVNFLNKEANFCNLYQLKYIYVISYVKVFLKLMIDSILSKQSINMYEVNQLLKVDNKIAKFLQIYILKIIRTHLDSYQKFITFNFTVNQILWVSNLSFKSVNQYPIEFLFFSEITEDKKKTYIEQYSQLFDYYSKLKKLVFRTINYDDSFLLYITKDKIDIFIDATFNILLSYTNKKEYLIGQEYNEFFAWVENMLKKVQENEANNLKWYKYIFSLLTRDKYEKCLEKFKQNEILKNVEIMLIGLKLSLAFELFEVDLLTMLNEELMNTVGIGHLKIDLCIEVDDFLSLKNLSYISLQDYYFEKWKDNTFKFRNIKHNKISQESHINIYFFPFQEEIPISKPCLEKSTLSENKFASEKGDDFSLKMSSVSQEVSSNRNSNERRNSLKNDSATTKDIDYLKKTFFLKIKQKFPTWNLIIKRHLQFLENKLEIQAKYKVVAIRRILRFLILSYFTSNYYFNDQMPNFLSKVEQDKFHILVIESFNDLEHSLKMININNIKLFMNIVYYNLKNNLFPESYTQKGEKTKSLLKHIESLIEISIDKYKKPEGLNLCSEYQDLLIGEKRKNQMEMRDLISDLKTNYDIQEDNVLRKFFSYESYPSRDDFKEKFNSLYNHENRYPLINKVVNKGWDYHKNEIDLEVFDMANDETVYDIKKMKQEPEREIEYLYDGNFETFEEMIVFFSKRFNLTEEGVNYCNGDLILYDYDKIEHEISKIFYGITIKE